MRGILALSFSPISVWMVWDRTALPGGIDSAPHIGCTPTIYRLKKTGWSSASATIPTGMVTTMWSLSRSDVPVKQDTLYFIYLKTVNQPPGPESEDGFTRLMQKLDNDFYVVTDDSGYAFFSRVLRLWWKTHFGFQAD